MSRHVVFGTGQVGLARRALGWPLGHDVVGVNRNGRGTSPGAQVVGGDATDAGSPPRPPPAPTSSTSASTRPNYTAGPRSSRRSSGACWPRAASAGARLVVLDNLYAYGPTDGRPLVETMPANPTSAKAATRAAMTDELLEAHPPGEVEVAIGRASDYFGPGAPQSALGETVFGAALGRPGAPR